MSDEPAVDIRPTTFKVPEGVTEVGYGHGSIKASGKTVTTEDVYERDLLRELGWEEVLDEPKPAVKSKGGDE